jgi:hypothetical protein
VREGIAGWWVVSTPERQTITVSICDCGMPVDEHSNWPRAGHIRATRAACITVADHEAVVVQAARDEREKIADEFRSVRVRRGEAPVTPASTPTREDPDG